MIVIYSLNYSEIKSKSLLVDVVNMELILLLNIKVANSRVYFGGSL